MRDLRISLVANGNAGRATRRAGLARVIGSILSRPPNPHRVYDTRTLAELSAAAQQIQRDAPDILAIAGGDGTVHRTLTAVLTRREHSEHPPPPILIVPTGTMNLVATALGITRRDPVAFVQRVTEKVRRGEPLDVVHARPLEVSGTYGFLYGAALPVHLLQRYYAGGTVRGPVRALRVVLEALLDELLGLLPLRASHQLLTAPVRAAIRLPAGHAPPVIASDAYSGIMVGAIDSVGVGCRALPRAMESLDAFMVRATQLSFWGLCGNIIQLFGGQSLPRTFDAAVASCEIVYDAPTVTTIDGELRAPTLRDTIACGPLLSFITG
ncbi:MAG: diacylglycerol kinase family protein [bacterium]|nr:diacylglycerol kinase family protein [bacterium]